MNTLVIPGTGLTDDPCLRRSIIRVPEIMAKLRESQLVLDKQRVRVDLINSISGDDSVYRRQAWVRMLTAYCIHSGLFERIQSRKEIDRVMAVNGPESGIEAILKGYTIEMVINELRKNDVAPLRVVTDNSMESGLLGGGFSVWSVFNRNGSTFEKSNIEEFDLGRLLKSAAKTLELGKIHYMGLLSAQQVKSINIFVGQELEFFDLEAADIGLNWLRGSLDIHRLMA